MSPLSSDNVSIIQSDRNLAAAKRALYARIDQIDKDFKGHTTIIIDVDPA